MSPTTEVYGADPLGIDSRDENNSAWLFLFDKEMMAIPGGVPVPVGGTGLPMREPIGPVRTATGRYIHIDAQLRGELNVAGLLCARFGGRIILTDLERSSFVTFHTDDALSVTVAYDGAPEDETP